MSNKVKITNCVANDINTSKMRKKRKIKKIYGASFVVSKETQITICQKLGIFWQGLQCALKIFEDTR